MLFDIVVLGAVYVMHSVSDIPTDGPTSIPSSAPSSEPTLQPTHHFDGAVLHGYDLNFGRSVSLSGDTVVSSDMFVNATVSYGT